MNKAIKVTKRSRNRIVHRNSQHRLVSVGDAYKRFVVRRISALDIIGSIQDAEIESIKATTKRILEASAK